MPPHHPILGHLLLVSKIMGTLPSDVHGHVLPNQIEQLLPNLGSVFYLDTWPFGPPMLVVANPDACYQITQSHSLPKYHALRKYMEPMTGGKDLVTMEASEWKTWRNIFNPGFSSAHLMTLVPDILKDMSRFVERLQEASKGSEVVRLDPMANMLSLDIICRVAL